jgi:hypothetical protein
MEFLEIATEIEVEDLDNTYQTRVYKIQTPLLQRRLNLGDVASKSDYLDHAVTYGNGYHIPTGGLNHSSLNGAGGVSHDELDSHVYDGLIHHAETSGALSLGTDWVNVDAASYGTPTAFKFGNYLRLRGLIKDGTSTDVLTVPVGFRPSVAIMQAVITSAGMIRADITTGGILRIYSTIPTWINLSTVGCRL